jgi:hypothetical protein
MTKLDLDPCDITRLFPASVGALEKLSENAIQEHEDILYSRKQLLVEIKQCRPRAFNVIVDSLKFNPAER